MAKVLREAQEIREDARENSLNIVASWRKPAARLTKYHAAIKQEGEAEKNRIIAAANQAAERIHANRLRLPRSRKSSRPAPVCRRKPPGLRYSLREPPWNSQSLRMTRIRFVDEYISKVVEAIVSTNAIARRYAKALIQIAVESEVGRALQYRVDGVFPGPCFKSRGDRIAVPIRACGST
ncbi:MAG: hypothetical protein MZV70_41390 [Desulfobacterales bacterium]|nr:hypothetical protein [Desulfobacterales bacterium]